MVFSSTEDGKVLSWSEVYAAYPNEISEKELIQQLNKFAQQFEKTKNEIASRAV